MKRRNTTQLSDTDRFLQKKKRILKQEFKPAGFKSPSEKIGKRVNVNQFCETNYEALKRKFTYCINYNKIVSLFVLFISAKIKYL